MKDYIEIGPVPSNEECEQVGPNYDPAKARAECVRFIQLIRKICGTEPEGAQLLIKSNPHDFGSYYDVQIKYDDTDPEGESYAWHVENNTPQNWTDTTPNKWTNPTHDDPRLVSAGYDENF